MGGKGNELVPSWSKIRTVLVEMGAPARKPLCLGTRGLADERREGWIRSCSGLLGKGDPHTERIPGQVPLSSFSFVSRTTLLS